MPRCGATRRDPELPSHLSKVDSSEHREQDIPPQKGILPTAPDGVISTTGVASLRGDAGRGDADRREGRVPEGL